MNSFRKFSLILFYYQVLGLCCVSLNFRSDKQRKYHPVIFRFWSLLNVFLVGSITLGFSYYVMAGHLRNIINVLKFYVIVLTHFVILVESTCTRQNHVRIWQNMATIDGKLKNIYSDFKLAQSRFYNKCLLKFLCYFAIASLIEIWIIASIQSDSEWTYIWSAGIIPLMISRSRHLQQTLYIDSLAHRFRVVKVELKDIVAASMEEKYGVHREYSREIVLLKDIYSTLWETSVLINRSYGFTQLINFLQNFFQLTCDLYVMYSILYQNNFTFILELLCSLVPTILSVTLVLNACENCLKQVRFIGFLLHNIEKDSDNHKCNILIENFSLLIIHEPLRFSVCGFFDMDFSLLKAMVAAITTYMVIFIQFMGKEEATTNSTTAATGNSTNFPLIL